MRASIRPRPWGAAQRSWYIPQSLPHVELYVPEALLSPQLSQLLAFGVLTN